MANTAAGAQGNTESATKAATTTTDTSTTAGAAPAAGDAGKGGTGTTATDTGKGTTDTGAAAQGDQGAKAGDKATEQPKGGAPEKYTLTIADEAKPYLDADDVKAFEAAGRKLEWTNEEAQQAMNDHAAAVADVAARFLAQTKADATYGGEQLAETQRLAKAAIDLIRPEGHDRRAGFMRFLAKSGAENNIEVVSFLADLGKRVGPDTATAGGGRSGKPERKSAAETLYDKS